MRHWDFIREGLVQMYAISATPATST
jgi:hypothetical protein